MCHIAHVAFAVGGGFVRRYTQRGDEGELDDRDSKKKKNDQESKRWVEVTTEITEDATAETTIEGKVRWREK